jgi:PAS domain S-box-containing protein
MPSQTMGFEELLEAMPDALLGVDKAGVIRFVNHQTELMFDYPREDLVGEPVEMLVPESLRQVHVEHRNSYFATPATRPLGAGLRLSGRRADGTEFPVNISLSHSDPGDDMLVIAAVRDMTDREKGDKERDQLNRLSAVVEFSGEAIISTTLDGTIKSWNPAAERLYGYSSKEIIGTSIMVLSSGSHAEENSEMLAASLMAGNTLENFETTGVRRDGTEFPASMTVSPIRDPDGAVIGASATVHDVTEQRQAFEADQRLASIVEYSQDAIFSMTLENVITTWNPAAERMFGYSGKEVIGKSGSIIIPLGYEKEIPAVLAKIKAGHPVVHLETELIRKDGTVLPVSATISPIRDADGLVAGASTIARDLTDQKRTFESARSMIETSLDALVAISPEGKITDANEATVKLTGVPRDKLIGTSFSDYFTDPKKAEQIYRRVFNEGMAVDYPLTLRHRNGPEQLTEVLYNASVYRDANGRVLGVFAAARDVTKRIQAQREAAHEQARELDRLAELERFQRLTVGRELKMIELKKEIEYLRKFGRPDD